MAELKASNGSTVLLSLGLKLAGPLALIVVNKNGLKGTGGKRIGASVMFELAEIEGEESNGLADLARIRK